MRRLTRIRVQGDSILKGIQVDPVAKRYVTRNEMDLAGLEQRFGLSICNNSHFGCTVVKGGRLLDRFLEKELPCDAVVMDFGGNDCDFKWAEIAADPKGVHQPNVPLAEFIEQYRTIIHKLRQREIEPILTTLPPLEPQRFFDWWCGGLDQEAVMEWLGGICNIYAYQEQYSRAVEQLARAEGTSLVDIRGVFLTHGHLGDLICQDGTHPNSVGQALITQAFRSFAEQWEADLRRQTA